MNAHFETNGIYPLSTVPAEGYGSDPLTRSGDVILSHVNGKHVKLNNDANVVVEGNGYVLVADRKDATKFENHSCASLAASKLIEEERATV